MEKKNTASFHQELLQILRKEVKKKPGKKSLKVLETLDLYEKGESDFSFMIENYQALAQQQDTQDLEQKLVSFLSWSEYKKLNLSYCTYPKMLRGLPRVFDRDDPTHVQIKHNFTDLKSLQAHLIDKARISLYQDMSFEKEKVVLLTWVMNDGWGDLITQLEISEILQENIKNIDLHLVTLLFKDVEIDPKNATLHKVFYKNEKDLKANFFKDDLIEHMSTASLILQSPTCFPDTEELLKRIHAKGNLFPKHEVIGQYGFSDSKTFHPLSDARCMGLNFLEKGILLKKYPKPQKEDLLQLDCKFLLQEQTTEEVTNYFDTHSLNLMYPYSAEGVFLYLYSVLGKKQQEKKDLDFVVVSYGKLFEMVEKYASTKSFFKQFKIQKIEMHVDNKVYILEIQKKKGKTLRFFCQDYLSKKDFQILLQLSEDCVMVRGDRSFSEAVSSNQFYFYDAPFHAKNFLKDLISLSEHYLKEFPETTLYLRLLFANIDFKDSKKKMVEEEFFQKDEQNIMQKAKQLTELFLNPKTEEGMKVLNSLIYRFYNANPFITNLVKRSLIHFQVPEIEQYEKKNILQLLDQKVSFSTFIKNLRIILSPYKNKG